MTSPNSFLKREKIRENHFRNAGSGFFRSRFLDSRVFFRSKNAQGSAVIFDGGLNSFFSQSTKSSGRKTNGNPTVFIFQKDSFFDKIHLPGSSCLNVGMGNVVPGDSSFPGYFTSSGHSKDRIDEHLSLSTFPPNFWRLGRNLKKFFLFSLENLPVAKK